METGQANNRLHLPDLRIEGFRCIDQLSIQKLGRVTLIAGRNSVGKTTVLNAVQVYAARGLPRVLKELLESREELRTVFDEDDHEISIPDATTLFHQRCKENNKLLSVGPRNPNERLHIELTDLDESSDRQTGLLSYASVHEDLKVLKIRINGRELLLPWALVALERRIGRMSTRLFQHRPSDDDEWPIAIECASLGPGLLGNAPMVRFWDKISLTDNEALPIQALQLMLDKQVHRVAVIGDERGRTGRHVIVRLSEERNPVPLRSLGDGAVRLFGVALALSNSRNGFVTIDEAENGIHYSVQRDFWRMVLQVAYAGNVQVLATTHSWDCVKGFAQAAAEVDDAEGVLVRLERDDEGIRSVEYSEADLKVAAEQNIEVR